MFHADKVDFLFRFVANDVRSKLQLDAEAMYSTTDQLTADKITHDILKFVPEQATITDATACTGGNTYSFSQFFSNVYAFEKDANRFMMLSHNMRVLGVTNVKMCCGDSIDLCKNQHQDVVFIDPPWGGPEYKKLDRVDLAMSDVPLSEFCMKIADSTSFIALKAPTNFNEAKFVRDTCDFMEVVHKNTQLRKMYLYILKMKKNE